MNYNLLKHTYENLYNVEATSTITHMKNASTRINSIIGYIDRQTTHNIGKISIRKYKAAQKQSLYQEYLNKKKKINDIIFEDTLKKKDIEEESREIIEKIKEEYKKTKPSEYLLIIYELNGTTYTRTVDSKFISVIEDFITDLNADIQQTDQFSDSDIKISLSDLELDDFTFIRRKRSGYQNTGSYFNFINTSKLDLSFLQIYNLEQYKEKINKQEHEHCLINTLKAFDIENEKIAQLKNIVENYEKSETNKPLLSFDFASRNLSKVANVINRKIKLTKFYTDKNNIFVVKNMKIYGDKKLPQINICLYENHYMPYIKTNIPAFVVKNYENICHLPDFQLFTRSKKDKYIKEKKYTPADTASIIHFLERTKLHKKHEILTKYIENSKSQIYMGSDSEQRQLVEKQERKIKNKMIFFADCETFKFINRHKVFLIGVILNDDEKDRVFIYKSTYDFLQGMVNMTNHLKKEDEVVIYFHNAKFDYSVMFKDYYKDSPIIKNGQFYQGAIRFKNRKFIIRDSYKHINIPLSSFKKAFKLAVGKKDIYMPYSIYNNKNIKREYILYNDLIKHNKEENIGDIEKLITQEQIELVDSYCFKKGNRKYFKHMQFMIDYLKYDCIVLKHGFLKHRQNIFQLCDKLEIERQDIFDILTTSSLAFNIYKAKNSYEGVYEVNGNRRRFIQVGSMGGRTGTQWNKKLLKKLSVDFDACAQYPSAIYRLLEEYGGIPTGKSKTITNYDSVKNNTYYVARIKVTAIKNNQQISFFCFKENNKRIYSGDFERFKKANPSQEMILDRITIEDYCKFQGMEYEFIEGVYWDTFNGNMSKLTLELYNLRKEFKSMKDENGNMTEFGDLMQSTCKLMLNSIYGKTLIKPSKEKIVTKSNFKKDNESTSEAEKFLDKNYGIVKYGINEKSTTTFYVSHNDFDDYNMCHVGCMILSMSKRIINEVMNTATENNIEIYYQDTDSMHLAYDKVELLREKYNQEYNRELIGKNMGQFHNDLEGVFDNNIYNCFASESVFLGKKAYLDVLKIAPDDKDNIRKFKTLNYSKEKINEMLNMEGYHIRLKGVGSKILKKNYKDIKDCYMRLYKGEELDFDLCKGGIKFENKNFNTIIQKKTFIRKVKFT